MHFVFKQWERAQLFQHFCTETKFSLRWTNSAARILDIEELWTLQHSSILKCRGSTSDLGHEMWQISIQRELCSLNSSNRAMKNTAVFLGNENMKPYFKDVGQYPNKILASLSNQEIFSADSNLIQFQRKSSNYRQFAYFLCYKETT